MSAIESPDPTWDALARLVIRNACARTAWARMRVSSGGGMFTKPMQCSCQTVVKCSPWAPSGGLLQAADIRRQMHDLVRAIRQRAEIDRQRRVDAIADSFNDGPDRASLPGTEVEDPRRVDRRRHCLDRLRDILDVDIVPK